MLIDKNRLPIVDMDFMNETHYEDVDLINDIYKNIELYNQDSSSENFENHPEFGFLPFNAPCEDCFEVIEKRTSNTRYYLKENSKGTIS